MLPVPNVLQAAMPPSFNPVMNQRTYTIQSSTDSVSGVFSDLISPSDPQTNGSQVTVSDVNAVESNKFYHVHISFP